MDRIARTGVLVLMLVVATLTAGVMPTTAAKNDTYELDKSTPLTDDATIATYEENGTATADVTQLDMRITVANDHEDVGLTGLEYSSLSDVSNRYLRVEYNESIQRTVRFYVPADYWHPQPREVDAESSDVTATLTPIQNDTYTAVEMTFDGPTDARFQISELVSGYYRGRDVGRTWVENKTGVELPTLIGDGTQWRTVSESDLTNNDSMVAFDTANESVMLHYNAADGDSKTWLKAPDCNNADDAPVCRLERGDTAYLVSDSDDPPPVRYKYGTDRVAEVQAAINELLDFDEWLSDRADSVTGVFGG